MRFLAGTSVFVLTLIIASIFHYISDQVKEVSLRNAVTEIGNSHAHSLSKQLDLSLSATYTLAAFLRQFGKIPDFDRLAEDIIDRYGGISNLQLAQDAVVSQIYPLKGNEAAIGHDLLNDPNRRTETIKTKESRKLTLAGPFELIQGGTAIIGRYPVYIHTNQNTEKETFWGFTIVLIKLPDLLKSNDIDSIEKHGYNYELSRIDPDSNMHHIFAKSAHDYLPDPVRISISVPNGEWFLSVAPKNGWEHYVSHWIEISGTLFISIIITIIFLTRLNYTAKLLTTNDSLHNEITERKKLEEALLDVEDKERQRIGYDLHDDLGQLLTAIAFRTQSLEDALEENKIPEADDVSTITSLVDQTKNRVTFLAKGVSPVEPDSEGLMSALDDLASQTSITFNMSCNFVCSKPVKICNERISRHLYRIAQEAVNNAIKHGKSKNISISLGQDLEQLSMTVKDDGTGFNNNCLSGMGCRIMKYRADKVGAALDVRQNRLGGTTVECILSQNSKQNSSLHYPLKREDHQVICCQNPGKAGCLR